MSGQRRQQDRGSALVIVLVVITVLTIYAAINSQSISAVQRELRRIEDRQVQRAQ